MHRPLLTSMQHTQHDDFSGVYAINQDKRCACNHGLTRIRHPARPANVRVFAQERFCLSNPVQQMQCRSGIEFAVVVGNRIEIRFGGFSS